MICGIMLGLFSGSRILSCVDTTLGHRFQICSVCIILGVCEISVKFDVSDLPFVETVKKYVCDEV